MGFKSRSSVAGAALAACCLFGSAVRAQPSAATVAPAPAETGQSDGVLLHRHTYFMPAPIDATWSALTDPRKRKVWFGYGADTPPPPPPTPASYFQRSVVDHPGLPGPTETTVALSSAEGGTLVTQTMIGLGGKEVWRNSVDPGLGIAEMMGDLALYLRTGAGFPRHTHVALRAKRPHPNDFAAGVREAPGGVELLDAPPGTLPDQLGMQPGDIIVALDDIGIYGLRDLAVARLGLAPGATVEVAWVRGGKVMRGTGKMTSTPIKWRNGFDPTKMRSDKPAPDGR